MLEPQTRTLLLDALRPPVGYRLDYAVGTTFSLDLVAMLAAPLAFALLDRTGPDGKLVGDPLALLEALRRNAGRIALFCQAGRIAVPRPDRLLLAYLERNVIEVKAPYGGVFHPKVWVLRFAADGQPIVYRFVCSSRNLTFDRSWDTALILEGKLIDRQNAYAANHPLGDFLSALPGIAVRPVPAGVPDRIKQLQAEVRKVDFEIPEGFEGYGFCPLGIEDYRALPFKGRDVRIDDLLVVSPFVCPEGLATLKKCASGGIRLVSRLDELQKLEPVALKGVDPIHVFSDEETEEEPVVEDAVPEEGLEAESQPELAGLHAKLYVADAGWNARLWTGSANATAAAFRRNVEFLVELIGKKSACGIAALLNTGANESGFASFLKPFVPSTAVPEDSGKRKLEETLDEVRLLLGSLPMRLRAAQHKDGVNWLMTLLLSGKSPLIPEGVQVRAWPISCKPAAVAQSLKFGQNDPELAIFASLSFEALSTFIAVEAEIPGQTLVGPVQFVLNLPAEGFPEDRANRLLLKLLDNSDAILRYVQLLLELPLAVPSGDPAEFVPIGAGGGNWQASPDGQILLEPLMRALQRERGRLDDVARLVKDLRDAGANARQLPPAFEEIWDPIWEARQRLGDEKPAA